ncbi:hypothetical protein EV174_007140 [Coemansia sp. RSA 2320]|nr:hypothetical protein EV174_007140 [Coemansia sp. RSA 2320]
MDKNANGWWLGVRNGVEGWIPSNYLSPDAEPEAPPPSSRRPPPPALPAAASTRSLTNGHAQQQQPDGVAQLAAALASRSPTGSTPTANGSRTNNVPAPRPGMNRFAQEDSDDEEAWE